MYRYTSISAAILAAWRCFSLQSSLSAFWIINKLCNLNIFPFIYLELCGVAAEFGIIRGLHSKFSIFSKHLVNRPAIGVASASKKFEVKVAQVSRRHFGPIFEPGQQGLLTLHLSVTRPQAQLILAAIWPNL